MRGVEGRKTEESCAGSVDGVKEGVMSSGGGAAVMLRVGQRNAYVFEQNMYRSEFR